MAPDTAPPQLAVTGTVSPSAAPNASTTEEKQRQHEATDTSSAQPDVLPDASNEAVDDEIPDGGYGWVVIGACSVLTFWINAWTGSWGILQVALLQQTLPGASSSTVSFIGSLGLALGPAMAMPANRVARAVGARATALLGITIYGLGNIASSFAVGSVPGLFVAGGLAYGVSAGLMYGMTNALPVQWFSRRFGTANGVVKLGGGVGATVMALATGAMADRLGIAWTFRVMGLAALATGVPAALAIREHGGAGARASYEVDWAVFRQGSFTMLFLSGLVGCMSNYVPPNFLPYVNRALGLSGSTSSGVVACFNASMAVGRLVSGILCDRFGAVNTYLSIMVLNAVTFFAVWSFSSTLAVLIVFCIFNGLANGSFFVAQPTSIGRLLGPKRAAGGISIALTGWFPGLLLGNPIAGFLIDATGADKATSIVPFRQAIFYAGGTAVLSAAFIVAATLAKKKV
jgi:MFS family permease